MSKQKKIIKTVLSWLFGLLVFGWAPLVLILGDVLFPSYDYSEEELLEIQIKKAQEEIQRQNKEIKQGYLDIQRINANASLDLKEAKLLAIEFGWNVDSTITAERTRIKEDLESEKWLLAMTKQWLKDTHRELDSLKTIKAKLDYEQNNNAK